MPYARRVPHVTEKGYMYLLDTNVLIDIQRGHAPAIA
jgi:hypothetical protein